MKLTLFIIMMILVAIGETIYIKRNSGEKKEMVVMVCICLFALIYGSIYIINPDTVTIARITIDLFEKR